MSRIAYVNGHYVRHSDAYVHIEDRGYQFADGIYEVCLVIDGEYWDFAGHMERLERSLAALRIRPPMGQAALKIVMREIVKRNRLKDAFIYLQVTRGVAKRYHAFPKDGATPALVVTAQRFDLDQSDAQAEKGVSVITVPDIRWRRVDIKTVGLLPNVLAKQAAKEANAVEAWLVRDGFVTEGSSSNAWIVNDKEVLITHPKTNDILAGITRDTLLACARDLQIKVEERRFTVEEAKGATEAFISSATNLVTPVIEIDGHIVANGIPGPISTRLRQAYKTLAKGG